jgi:nucleoside-diphosphate-sugar epimerase
VHIAFIGGTRFIGHAAAAEAVSRGHQVTVLHRGVHQNEIDAAHDVLVNRNDPSALCEALARVSPDVVVDCRAMTKNDGEIFALALAVLDRPGVVLSSQDVYAQFGRLNGLPAPEPEARVAEDAPLSIEFPFRGIAEHEGGPDYDKKQVEAVLRGASRDKGTSVVSLRLPGVFGSGDPKRRFSFVVDRLDAGDRALPRVGGAAFRLTHAHIRDVAHAVVLAAERPLDGFSVFNVGEESPPTMAERTEALARAMGVELEWIESEAPLPPGLELLGTMPNDFVADTRAIRRALGYAEVTTAEERDADVVAWLRRSRD